MRIQKLYLDAFGPFTNYPLDLSNGKEGLHIIYGPNEAGKSSALRAISQLLFGIPPRSTDDFVHPHNSMCIGGTISDGVRTLNINRRKGNKGTLRNRDTDEVLEESALDLFLGGINKETFEIVFGLSHNNLVQGGRDIVEGKGNVGEALFAASAGLGNPRIVLESLKKEAEELFKPSGSKPKINASISKLSEVRKNLKTKQLRPSDWSDKDKELHLAIESRDNIERIIRETRAEKNRFKRMLDASPYVAKYSELMEQLRPVANAHLLPEDFDDKFRDLLNKEEKVLGMKQVADEDLKSYEEALDKLSINETVLIQENEIEHLYKLYATNTKALRDSHEILEPQLHLLEKQAIETLELFRLGVKVDAIPSLRIKPSLRSRIIDLGQKNVSVKNRFDDAVDSLEKLKIRRSSVMASLENIELLADPDELEKTIKRIRKSGDIEERIREKQKNALVAKDDILVGITRLGLWNGAMEELELLAIPSSETIERFRGEYARLDNDLKKSNDRKNETEDEYNKVVGQISDLKQEHNIPNEILLREYRNSRNSCWRLVRQEWENVTPPGRLQTQNVSQVLTKLGVPEKTMENLADTYEFITLETDGVSDRLRTEADRVAKLAQLEARKVSLKKKNEDLVIEHNNIEAEYKKCEMAWSELWSPLGIETRSPKEMAQWARNQKELADSIGEFRSLMAEINKFESLMKNNLNELRIDLESLDKTVNRNDESLAVLLDRAESKVSLYKKKIEERTQLEKTLKSLDTKEIPEAELSVAESKEKLAAWVNEWAEAMNALGENNNISPSEANAIVQQIDNLTVLYDRIDGFKTRIDQINEEDRHFRDEVRKLVKVVEIDTAGLSEEHAIQKLYNELKNNRSSKSEFDTLRNQSAQAKKRIGDSKDKLTQIREGIAALCREAQVKDRDELDPAWKRSVERLKYEQEIDSIKENLIGLSLGLSLGEFIEIVKNENIDAIEPALLQLDEKIRNHENELKVVSEKIGSISKELEQMDGSAVAAQLEEDAQSLLAEISTNTEQYARLKISEIILARAIEQYRMKNQGPLLNRAGEIFSGLTLGSFDRLRTDFGSNDEDILVGIRSGEKGSVEVPGMSDGTADQLYLALRLASLERYFDNHPPIPFILDDILVNFDNERATATLKMLADLSQHTQIIFFTHHRHIVDIAKENINENIFYTYDLC
ncbi:MAG: AAA family ATPase [Candidatus Latescibacter sp.]|nr:AAA family ATPase [Candidatus Latescibacter sp.]